MKKNVHTKIAFRAHRGGPRGEVLLATNDAQESHLNIYLRPSTRSSADCCIHPDDAKALRDALIEIYPIESPIPAPKPYEVQAASRMTPWGSEQRFYLVSRKKFAVEESHDVAAECRSLEEATRIADLLNKAGVA